MMEKDIEKFLYLTTYIEQYQQKLGLYGTHGKINPIDEYLGTRTATSQARAANKVSLDYNTFKISKVAMEEKLVRSEAYEAAEKLGVGRSTLANLNQTEVPKII